MTFLLSPWLLAGLVGYAVLTRFTRLPYRWLGLVAVFMLVATAVLVARGQQSLAEPLAQASYSWFVAFAVALVLDTVTRRADVR